MGGGWSLREEGVGDVQEVVDENVGSGIPKLVGKIARNLK